MKKNTKIFIGVALTFVVVIAVLKKMKDDDQKS